MSSFITSTKRAFRQPAFLAAFVVLAICAAALNVTANWLKVTYIKRAVPLRVASLKEGIPSKIGHWMQVSNDQGINPEEEQILGTGQYVFRDYVNTRALALQPSDVEAINKSPANERAVQLAQWRASNPTAVV